MNVLVLHAHPEPRSLTSSLKNFAVSALERAGHEVRVSDLYAMKWKATLDIDDFPAHADGERLYPTQASGRAFATKQQAADVSAEQEKVIWADALILNFPLWWYGMPAILKGWFDRVWAAGWAYDVGRHGGSRWGIRFGEGTLQGKRALLVTTIGGRAPQYGPRGVNGHLDDLLFPLTHGCLFYPGIDVLPPLAFFSVGNRVSPADYEAMCARLQARLDTLATAAVTPFRPQNYGDYDASQVLLPHLSPAATGLSMHQRMHADPVPVIRSLSESLQLEGCAAEER
jgi:NAD(P)H dehydrogenase (quinone)